MRRGSNKTNWAKYCCREHQAEAIQMGITSLRNRAVGWHQPDLTVTDLLHIFVPPHRQQLARDAYKYLLVSGHKQILFSSTTGLDINIYISKPEFAVVNLQKGKANDCPERTKLDEWAAWRFDRGMEWATVKAVWHGLQKACHMQGTNQLKVVRYLWPTVMTLLEAGGDKETADKLRDVRPPDHVPHLPPPLRGAMKVTAGIVAGTLLLPNEPKENPVRAVRVCVTSADQVRPVDLGWGVEVRPL